MSDAPLRGTPPIDLYDGMRGDNAPSNLPQQTSLLQAILDGTDDVIFAKDLDGRYVLSNLRGAMAIGQTQASILGQTDADLFDEPTASRNREQDLRVINSGEQLSYEQRFVDRRGFVSHCWMKKVPLRDADERIIGVIGIGRDISHRRQMEAERALLATAIEQSGEVILIRDLSHRVVYANSSVERCFGRSRDEVIGLPARAVVGRNVDASLHDEIEATVASGATWRGQLEVPHEGGGICIADVTISPVLDSAGKITNFIDVWRDVTREAQLNAQLRQAQKLEVAGQMATGVAHDFNNILIALLGFVDLARSNRRDESAAQRALGSIESLAQQGVSVVRGLMTFAGRAATAKRPARLTRVMRECVDLLRHTLPAMVSLKLDLDERHDPWVEADVVQLQQVFMNLAVNARDAMPNGGELTIRLRVVDTASPQARIEVCDNGVGIAPEVREHVFEPFFTTKQRDRGTGLGLAIVHGIVAEHHGTIEVQSDPGRGTTFVITLPAVAPRTEIDADAAESTPCGSGELVLLIERDPYIERMIAGALRQLRYRVATVTDNAPLSEAVARHDGELRALIVDLDGASPDTTLEALRSAAGVPCVVLTDASNEDLPPLPTGARILRKPYTLPDVGRALHELLTRSPDPSKTLGRAAP